MTAPVATASGPRAGVPAPVKSAAAVAAALAALSVAAAVGLIADLGPADLFHDAARSRTDGGVGDLVVGVVLAVVGACVLAGGSALAWRGDTLARRFLLSGASVTS